MKRIILPIIVFSLFCQVSAFCLEIPDGLESEVTQAMDIGAKLYHTYLQGPCTDSAIVKQKDKISDLCDFQYSVYIVDSDTYFIAESSSTDIIVFGKHYKVSSDGIASSSTKTCFSIPIPKNSGAAVVTHLLSDTPSEFHVFLSLKYKTIIYVGTQKGAWKVDQGKITFIGE